jgi:hypothetical protein
MPAAAWVGVLSVIFVVGIYTPSHLILRRVFAGKKA